MGDMEIETAKQAEQIATLQREMKEIKIDVKAIKDISLSVQSLAHSVETLTTSMLEIKSDVAEIKKEPASAWKNFKWILVGMLTTGILGGIITALFTLITND